MSSVAEMEESPQYELVESQEAKVDKQVERLKHQIVRSLKYMEALAWLVR
jgi:hypothetical protein